MKKLYLVLIMLMVMVSSVIAEEKVIMNIDLNTAKVEYVEIKTSKSLFRIYPCGKIEKKTWKEIHENEDDNLVWSSIGVIPTYDGTTILEITD